MKAAKHIINMLLCLTLVAPCSLAQPVQDQKSNQPIPKDVTIIIQPEQVRVVATQVVEQLHLQVTNPSGEVVFDSGGASVQEISWQLYDTNGAPLKNGLYAYVLTVKTANNKEPRVRRGHFIVDRAIDRDTNTNKLWVTSQNDNGVGVDLTVARDENATVVGTTSTSHGAAGQQDSKSNGGEDKVKSEKQSKESLAAVAGTIGRIAKFTSTNDLGDSVITEQTGNIGIGTTSPISKFHVVSSPTDISPPRLQSSGATSFAAGWDFYHGATPKGYVGVPGSGQGVAGGEMLVYGSPGAKTSLWAGGARSVTIDTNGSVGIGTPSPDPNRKLDIVGNGATAAGIKSTNDRAFLSLTSAINGQTRTWSVESGVYGLQDTFGIYNWQTGKAVVVDPNGRLTASEIRIAGGADFAEHFDVKAPQKSGAAVASKIEAGMIVSIDPRDPGKLTLSTSAYDRRVAGIISGAGGVKPGVTMGQEGTLADGQHPVALSGRVYVWVDAARGAIKPGDLLTTSATPGHAMKVNNSTRAQGAIIGKAMTGLKSGKGLVLVLVTLQ